MIMQLFSAAIDCVLIVKEITQFQTHSRSIHCNVCLNWQTTCDVTVPNNLFHNAWALATGVSMHIRHVMHGNISDFTKYSILL